MKNYSWAVACVLNKNDAFRDSFFCQWYWWKELILLAENSTDGANLKVCLEAEDFGNDEDAGSFEPSVFGGFVDDLCHSLLSK